ncbi:MAG: MarR family winged helix-turn-helix transcriptional regulator [Mobilitalea sp.]
MNDNKDQVCNLCHNHCSVDNLLCDRGRNYFNNYINEGRSGINMSDNHDENIEKHHHDNHQENHHENHHENHYENHQEDHHHEDHHHDNHHEDHHKDHHMRHCQEENHKEEHERHCNHEMAIFGNNEDNLLTLLGKCGHFMHHKRGGKRGQGKILTILAANPGISQKELQEKLGIESGSMSEIVMKLEHKGLITRTKDETDRRMTNLLITDLGLELSKEVESRDLDEDKLLFGSLTEEEQEQLKALLKKMLQGWEVNYEVIRERRHCHTEGEEHCHKGGRRHHKYHLHSSI